MKKILLSIILATVSLFGVEFNVSALKCDEIIEHTDYDICYDDELRAPVAGWAILYGEDVIIKIKKRPWYHSDKGVDKKYRRYHHIKRNSLVENGHTIVADADEDFDWDILKEAYSLANITPQYKNFNRRVWSKVEYRGRYLAERYGEVKSITLIEYKNNKVYKGWSIPSKYYRIYETTHFNECYAYTHKRYPYRTWKNDTLSQHKICCDKLYQDR